MDPFPHAHHLGVDRRNPTRDDVKLNRWRSVLVSINDEGFLTFPPILANKTLRESVGGLL